MRRPLSASLGLLILISACGGHLGGEGGSGGSAFGGRSGGGAGGVAAGADPGGSFAGGGAAGSVGAPEYPPSYGYEYVFGCERVEHPGRSVLTLFDDAQFPFIPQQVSGDGQVAAGLVGEVAGSWRGNGGFEPYDAGFRGQVYELDCTGDHALLRDTQNRSAIYQRGTGVNSMLGSVPSQVLPMKLNASDGTALVNYIDRDLDWLQPYYFDGGDLQPLEEYRNTVLYNVDRDGYALGVDALRVFYRRPWSQGQDIALVADTGPVPHVIVSGNEGVLAVALESFSVLWGPLVPADPRRQRMVVGNQSVPLALSGAGRVLLLSDPGEQIWIEETYFTAGGGYRDLNTLAAAFGADLGGERLYAVDMSQDAQAFVGYTTRAGRRVGFHLTIPREAYPSY